MSEGNTFVRRVQIRNTVNNIENYTPPKGIDISFTAEDPDEVRRNPKGSHRFNVTMVGSDLHPDTPITQGKMNEVMAKWKTIVNDRASGVKKEPVRHRIDVLVTKDRQAVTIDEHKNITRINNQVLEDKMEKLEEKDIDLEASLNQKPVEGITETKDKKKVATVFWGDAKEI